MDERTRARWFLPFLAVMALVFLLAGCENTGYKVLGFKEGFQGFSLEYPESYQFIHIAMENTPSSRYTEIGLSENDAGLFSEIYAYLREPDSQDTSADSMMDQLLDDASSNLNDYNLAGRTRVMLGDTIASQATFNADSSFQDAGTSDNTSPPPPRPATYRITTMIFGGVGIEISQTCDDALVAATQSDYQHVLDTFAIVN